MWRQDIQHDDIQNNDILLNDIQHNDIQHNDIQLNDIQHNNKWKAKHSVMALTRVLLGWVSLMLSVANNPFMLNVVMLSVVAPWMWLKQPLAIARLYCYNCLR